MVTQSLVSIPQKGRINSRLDRGHEAKSGGSRKGISVGAQSEPSANSHTDWMRRLPTDDFPLIEIISRVGSAHSLNSWAFSLICRAKRASLRAIKRDDSPDRGPPARLENKASGAGTSQPKFQRLQFFLFCAGRCPSLRISAIYKTLQNALK
jgi:hypothetical protein